MRNAALNGKETEMRCTTLYYYRIGTELRNTNVNRKETEMRNTALSRKGPKDGKG